MNNTFCPIPWIFQAVKSNGDLRVCCQANVTPNKGVLRKDDGTPYNARFDTLEQSRNSTLIKKMRQNMLSGIWSEECSRCKIEEETGLISRRIYEKDKNLYSYDQALADTKEDGSIDTNNTLVKYYDLRFGNFCNLKCRMCGPTDSNAWYTDWIQLNSTNEFSETSGKIEIQTINGKYFTPEYNWVNSELFWEELEKNIPNIRYVYFAGGEPMLIERHYDFLERCVNLGVSNQISIEYNTNMSTIPTRVINLWKLFKQVNIGASVDGFGKMQEYHRHPSNWKKTYANLKKIDSLGNNVYAWLAVTITAYNVFHVVDFMKWKLTQSGFKKINSSNKRRIITHHVAHYPKHLNIRVLPDPIKDRVVEHYLQFVKWVNENNFDIHDKTRAKEIADSVIKYMMSGSYYDSDWKNFTSYTKKLDKIRNENLVEIEPLFKDLGF